MPVNGVALAAVGAGTVLLYSGITGKGVLATVQATVQGTAPSSVPQTNPIAGASAAAVAAAETAGTVAGLGAAVGNATGAAVGAVVGGSSGTGDAIAARAQSYVGDGYVWAGAPAKGVGNWDCSSFANWVIGHDSGLAIPGYAAGKYTGESHGPVTLQWLAWTGCTTIGHSGAVAEPGDLCCWQTHIGIAIGGGKMVSARSAKDNPPTGINTIDGAIAGEILFVRRLKAVEGPTSSGTPKGAAL